MACRNQTKAETAKAEVIAKVNSADVEIMILDLKSLSSVRNFATLFCEKIQPP